VAFVLLWEALPHFGGLLSTFIAPPSVVILTLVDIARRGDLLSHVLVSFGRALAGFALAACVGVPLGFLLGGRFPTFQRIVRPVLAFLGKLNPFSLFPVFVMLFGIGEVSKTIMVFWVAVWPMLFNTTSGVREIDPALIRAAKTMSSGPMRLFFQVVLPAASPSIFTGLRFASSTAFFMLIAAEMIGATKGLGFMVWNAQVTFRIPELFAATVVISILGLAIDALLGRIERRVLRWHAA
jgi:NitT/TauT family transport system permease protein